MDYMLVEIKGINMLFVNPIHKQCWMLSMRVFFIFMSLWWTIFGLSS